MATAGRKPNEGTPVRHRVKPVHEWAEIEDVPFATGPELPELELTLPWPSETREWWRDISAMPHCVLWEDSDWRFAVETARVVAAFHRGAITLAGEIRQREKVLGTTWEARRDLRIRYVPAGARDADSAGVTAIEQYRDRLKAKA
jgi:hypothetical protein